MNDRCGDFGAIHMRALDVRSVSYWWRANRNWYSIGLRFEL